MASKLADELLKEILSPPLLVPDELFADTGDVSPFSKATYSAADVLLVCKRWMRVATPALYATVVIRSLAQAQALVFALKRSPDFGRYIKKLRLEGAFGQHLAVLATTAPNITDLCFSLAIYADSNVKGLLKLLAAVSPERVILTTAPAKVIKNKGHAEVVRTLCDSIPQWTRLRAFSFSSSLIATRRWNVTTELQLYPEIALALASSASLRTVHLRLPIYGSADPALENLASNQHVETYHISTGGEFSTVDALSIVPNEMRRRASVVDGWNSIRVPDPILSNPFYSPMSDATDEVRTSIWTRILEYAVRATYFRDTFPRWFDHQHYSEINVLSVMRVSKEFQAMTVRILFRHVMIKSLHAYETAKRYFEQFQISAETVQTLSLGNVKLAVSPLVSQFKGLRSASVHARSDLLALVGDASGATLEELTVVGYTAGNLPVSALAPFTHIVTLHWTTAMTLDNTTVPSDQCVQLPRLHTIEQIHGNVFDGLAGCDIPSLEKVHIVSPVLEAKRFFETHGHRVRSLVTHYATRPWLDGLVNLESIKINGSSFTRPDWSVFEGGHATLRVLMLPWNPAQPGNRRADDHWQDFFDTFTSDIYPSLQEIRLTHVCEIWPANEREIKKSPWPEYAAGLAAEGIALLDYTGRAWRPRLSARR
ncbi:hypothetical protein EXIGLDRAFT_846808 [Exidia glandulosa HHB12029]|uniref:Uncharacterized protein n=1 Tax=Exidia glandulosa HHB12029 TaxID=1314781 RepID=A0A166NHE3_EXIGL|nr:hypothetical protein EXIGLDRAFT_846808 [Exidia glandulosa HHB12029]